MINWIPHPEYEGKHAFFSASQNHWLKYDDDTLAIRYYNSKSPEIGTAIHAMAKMLIDSRIKLTKDSRTVIEFYLTAICHIPKHLYDADEILSNLKPFVNDAIQFHMSSEVVLFYTPEAFGTADCIRADEQAKELRIHDYKNGQIEASFNQLMVYAAYFFLEYRKVNGIDIKPIDWKITLRIYQYGEIREIIADPHDIMEIMDIIVDKVKKVKVMKGEIK